MDSDETSCDDDSSWVYESESSDGSTRLNRHYSCSKKKKRRKSNREDETNCKEMDQSMVSLCSTFKKNMTSSCSASSNSMKWDNRHQVPFESDHNKAGLAVMVKNGIEEKNIETSSTEKPPTLH